MRGRLFYNHQPRTDMINSRARRAIRICREYQRGLNETIHSTDPSALKCLIHLATSNFNDLTHTYKIPPQAGYWIGRIHNLKTKLRNLKNEHTSCQTATPSPKHYSS